jgi:osmotically-inducible protein OsmY
MNTRLMTITAIAATAATMGLAGCDRGSPDSARNTADRTVAQADQKTKQMGNEMKSGAQRMGDKMDDAAITASVKTEIAKDSELSALRINVDTDNGRVALKGTAPSPAAKEHATTLAQGVKGVTGVDNQLTVEAKK